MSSRRRKKKNKKKKLLHVNEHNGKEIIADVSNNTKFMNGVEILTRDYKVGDIIEYITKSNIRTGKILDIKKVDQQITLKDMHISKPQSLNRYDLNRIRIKLAGEPNNRAQYDANRNTPKIKLPIGCKGLINFGHSGWMNSVIHCLAQIPIFNTYFISGAYKKDINTTNSKGYKGELAEEFAKLLCDIWSGEHKVIVPSAFLRLLNTINSNEYSIDEANCPRMFLLFLLNGLNEDLKSKASIIDDLFFVKMKFNRFCPCCDAINAPSQEGYHININVDIPEHTPKPTLYDCIHSFTAKKQIMGASDVTKCNICGKIGVCSRYNILSTPEILIIELYKDDYRTRQKNLTFIDCPINGFDLTKYVVNDDIKSPSIYDLCGVVNHCSDTIVHGFCDAYALHMKRNCWYYFRDEYVRPALQSEIITCSTSILFYKKRKPLKQVNTMKQCGYCNKGDVTLRCSQCKSIFYCNKTCQSADWKQHKIKCSKTKTVIDSITEIKTNEENIQNEQTSTKPMKQSINEIKMFDELKIIKQQLVKLKSKNSSFEIINNTQLDEISFLKSENNVLQKDIKTKNDGVKRLISQNNSLKSETNKINELETENNSLHSKMETQSKQLGLSQMKYEELEHKYVCLMSQEEKQLNDLQNSNKEMKNKYISLDKKYEKLLKKQKSNEDYIDKLEYERKEMEIKYNELEEKYIKIQKKFGFECWTIVDIAEWIIKLDSSRYGQYYDTLLINMKNEGINGSCLAYLDKNDLHRLGITQFKDKLDVYNAIQTLVRKTGNNNNQNEGESDTYI